LREILTALEVEDREAHRDPSKPPDANRFKINELYRISFDKSTIFVVML
jgi:hypothetical protein